MSVGLPPITNIPLLDRWLSTFWKSVRSGQVFDAATTGATVGAAGGASALPATPAGYITTTVNGQTVKIPYYLP